MLLKIFPATLIDNKKIPLIDKWAENSTTDINQIQRWQQQFGDRIKLWGAPTGSINGISVLDIDVKGDVNGFQKLKDFGINELPNTAYQYTPTGGLHLIFKDDPSLKLRNTANKRLGLDTRNNGGWIGVYDIKNMENIQPIPRWVFDITKKSTNEIDQNQKNLVVLDSSLAVQQYQQSIQSVLAALPGERNQTLNTHAYIIGKMVIAGAIPYDRAFEDLTNAAKQIGLDPYETQATILSGLKGGAAKPLTHPFGDTPPIPVCEMIAPVPDAPQPRPRWTPLFATLQDLTNWTYLKRPQLFKDWAPQDIILTSAIGGVGKTTLKLYEAVCLALGEPFLGFECSSPGRTLFIIGEDSEKKLYAMLGQICKQMGLLSPGQEHRLEIVRQSVVIKHTYELSLVAFDQKIKNYVANQEAIELIKEAIDDLNPKQIIFDPIGVFGSEAGGNDSAKALMQTIQKIRDLSDASVDIISHIGKDSATRKDVGQFSARGATSFANHSRVVRTLLKLNADEYQEEMGEPLPENLTAIKVFVSKFSDGSPILEKPFIILREGYLFMRKDIPANVPKAEGDQDLSFDKQRVLDFIKTNSNESKPVTIEMLTNHFYLQKPKITKSRTKAIIGSLKMEKLVEEIPHIDETVGYWLRFIQ